MFVFISRNLGKKRTLDRPTFMLPSTTSPSWAAYPMGVGVSTLYFCKMLSLTCTGDEVRNGNNGNGCKSSIVVMVGKERRKRSELGQAKEKIE